jgi:hypothetical protein
MKKFLGVVAALVLTASMAYGQTSKGTLVGVARDATGAVLAGATVTITDEATGAVRSAKTTSQGVFRFDAIEPGPYTIVTSSTGFETAKVTSVRVDASVVTSYDVKVSVGKTADVVSVDADTATLNTENGQLAGVISQTEIEKLPIFSQNAFELALTIPGVQTSTQGTFSQGQEYTVNGARPRANNFLIDGQEVNDVAIGGQAFQPAIPGVVESVTAIVNSGDAEYGRAGGAVVNLTTRSGTNTIHGSVFERYTGSGLNSTPGGLRGQPYNPARNSSHAYGFTLGGPLLKNKLFVFGGLQLTREFGQETPGINLLPDAAGYAALQSFTGTGVAAQVALFDSYLSNGSYLTQDKIYYKANSASGTPVTTKTVGGVTGPNCGGALAACTVTFAGFQRPNVPLNNPDTQWMYRVDYHPFEKDSFGFRYLHDRTSLTPDFYNNPNALLNFDTLQGGPSELGEGFWTHQFTSNLLNEFRASEARVNFQFAPTSATLANPLNALASVGFSGLTGTSSAGTLGFPTLGPNQNFPQGRAEDYYQFQDTVTYSHGKQTVRAGVDIGRLIEIEFISQNAKGSLGFVAGGSGVTSLGNFLLNQLGPSGTATKTFGPTRVDAHGYRNGVFVQDDIKLTADLTINLGFRWDFLTNPENNLAYPGLDPTNLAAPINTVSRIQNDYHNYSPRVGFAYSPHGFLGKLGDGKTVIRGGFGVFYDSTFSNILVNSAQSSPNSVSGLLTQTTGNGLSNATGLIPSISPLLNPLSSVTSEVNNFVNPITSEYNLGIQRELPGQISLDIRYVGNNASNQFANQQYNYFSGLTGQRLNPARGAINARGNYAVSNYNSIQISAEHKFRQGVLIRTNYVYGKDLSTGDEVFTVGSPTSYDANLAVGGRSQEYGNSVYDHRQFFSVAYVYSPKGFHSSNAIANGALGLLTRHWTVSGITQLQSGQYTTIAINGLDINGDGSSANDRAVISNLAAPKSAVGIDGAYIGGTPGTYYDLGQLNNPGNVVVGPASQFHYLVPVGKANQFLQSEIGRNSLLAPGTTRNDLTLEKGFGLAYLHLSRGSMILRAEGQNVFNHNDNVLGDSSILDINAGYNTPTRTGSQRSLVLRALISF